MLSFGWSPSVRQLPTPRVPLSNPLVTVPNAPNTTGIIVTCMFHRFFNSLTRSRYLSFFSHSFRFILCSAGTAKSTILQILFFLLIIIRSDYYYYYYCDFFAPDLTCVFLGFFFAGVWLTMILLKSPGLFWVSFPDNALAWMVPLLSLISNSQHYYYLWAFSLLRLWVVFHWSLP